LSINVSINSLHDSTIKIIIHCIKMLKLQSKNNPVKLKR
jgi:hypothetical protein